MIFLGVRNETICIENEHFNLKITVILTINTINYGLCCVETQKNNSNTTVIPESSYYSLFDYDLIKRTRRKRIEWG